MEHIEFLLKIKDIKNRWEKIEKFTKSDEYYLTRRYVNLPTRSEIEKNFLEIESNNLINDIKKSLSAEEKSKTKEARDPSGSEIQRPEGL